MSPNDFVRMKLTEEGKRQIVKHDDEFNEHMRRNHPNATYRTKTEWDNEGWIKGQFWTLMQYFTWTPGHSLPFTEMEICK